MLRNFGRFRAVVCRFPLRRFLRLGMRGCCVRPTRGGVVRLMRFSSMRAMMGDRLVSLGQQRDEDQRGT